MLDYVYDLLEEEKDFISGRNQYSKKFKSYKDFIESEIEQCEGDIQDLKVKRD